MTRKGFSLVELLVVVSLITVLSVTGLVMFQSARGKAQEAKYRGDVDAIKKAYEKNYNASLNNGQGGYKVVQDSDFASGKKPKDKNGNDYIITIPANPDGSVSSYAACINPQTGLSCLGPNSETCACAVSTQGGGSQFSSTTSSSCDPYGVLGNGLVGYWKMDEGSWINNCSTTSVTDYSNNGNNGRSCPNGVGPTATVAGKFGNAGNFDGSNDQIQVASTTSLNTITSQMTVSAWVTATTLDSSFRRIISRGGYPNQNWYIENNGSTPGKILFNSGNGGGNSTTTLTTGSGTWYHIIMTNDGSKTILYINGSLDKEVNNSTTTIGTAGTISIGSDGPPGNGASWHGKIDDVRIYNRALSAQEITALYNNGNGCIP